MDSLLTFGIIFCVCWVAGSFLMGVWDSHQAAKAALRDKLYKKLDEIIHRVKVEEHHGHLYWFDEDDDEFLAQGATQEDIINIVKKRFPQHIFFLSKNQVVAESTNWQPAAQSKVEFTNLTVE